MEKDCKDKWDVVIEYFPLIDCMAKSYSNLFISYDDLFQEACIAVYDNISTYDPNFGKTLYSFLATRIRYHYFDLFNQNRYGFFVPLGFSRKASKLRRLQEKARCSTGEYLSEKEAGEQLNFSETTIANLENLNQWMSQEKILSLPDFFVKDEADDIDSMGSENEVAVSFISSTVNDISVEEEVISKICLEEIFDHVLDKELTEKQKLAILYHLGFVTWEQEEFDQVAEIVGGTRQNAHIHYWHGIKRLRKYFSENN